MSRTQLVLSAVVGLSLSLSLARPAGADPMKCVVVRDAKGREIQTVCIPWVS